jgi:hypothetical protein
VENNALVLFQGFDESETRKKKVLNKEFLRENHPMCKLLFENEDQINKQSVRNVYVSYKDTDIHPTEPQSATQKPATEFSNVYRSKSLSTRQQVLKVNITKRATMCELKVNGNADPGGSEKRVKFASRKTLSRRTSQSGLAVKNLASAAGAVIGRPSYLKGLGLKTESHVFVRRRKRENNYFEKIVKPKRSSIANFDGERIMVLEGGEGNNLVDCLISYS